MNKSSVVTKRARLRGFTLIEVLVALALTALMVGGVATMINSSLEDTRGQQAALYQQLLSGAARQYIQQNFASLSKYASAGTPVVVGVTGGTTNLSTFLPPNTTPTNPYGQTPCLLVYSDASGMLNGLLVTEGGTTIPDPELGYIAANSGQGAGSIPATNNGAGTAIGAFGEWKRLSPNPAGKSCSGTKTGTGHLATEVYYNGNQVQNTDYLYRVSVPGNIQANTMQVPIVLAPQTDYQGCVQTQSGSIAADSTGNVVVCQNTNLGYVWAPQASFHWRGQVTDEASLVDLTSTAMPGDVAMTLKTNRAYTYNGATKTWQALAVNEAGNLDLGNSQTLGATCTPDNPASATSVTTDATGTVMSCEPNPQGTGGNTWQSASAITPVTNAVVCAVLLPEGNGSGANDYPCQVTGAPSSDPTTNTQYYDVQTKVVLNKTGVINVSAWEHMNDGTAGTTYTSGAEIAQYIYIEDSTGNSNTALAHNESQSPILINDSSGINNSLSYAGVAGTYYVEVKSAYAHFAETGTNPLPARWTSSYVGGNNGNIVFNTPVAAGWTISTYY
ncbi:MULTISPECIES: prepilin-type N-terminal cleavage/methylation domain-containing protein [Paraburkholderia]|uniref:prepilin-type N-terminal cleavage/methylation domain-containing protein n=1 Tax=Paraburkholderia TaxID=1822464 RepID=UPI002257BFEB|nr:MULTISPECIES: prepilin-type N-terminal cleavage/methylation domain-containing protein [Paraburkholderia]MCX4161404.1 prepilin-type N-terminal cleavage/methylation domain-containing protein [Paraburkholderia megapolitana]MDN7156900.1 prepilin-type N-terminal cleavage/methylation domain-containing protein [Paraburkholderia sp. CHISQ3]MDQ6493945.1 prepilin-type N-terminal cleavage/methylation domain-containing protein [Paraburkholderia megapolitana]